MREIKFRAWDGELKWMVDDVFACSTGAFDTPDKGYNTPYIEIEPKPHYIVMQFTGLQDRNGKDIYEGDVVESHSTFDVSSYIRTVVWGKHCGLEFNPLSGFTLCKENESYFEIIGNIHESPKPDSL